MRVPKMLFTPHALPYFVYDGGSTGRADGHGHDGPSDSNRCYNKHLRDTAQNMLAHMSQSVF